MPVAAMASDLSSMLALNPRSAARLWKPRLLAAPAAIPTISASPLLRATAVMCRRPMGQHVIAQVQHAARGRVSACSATSKVCIDADNDIGGLFLEHAPVQYPWAMVQVPHELLQRFNVLGRRPCTRSAQLLRAKGGIRLISRKIIRLGCEGSERCGLDFIQYGPCILEELVGFHCASAQSLVS